MHGQFSIKPQKYHWIPYGSVNDEREEKWTRNLQAIGWNKPYTVNISGQLTSVWGHEWKELKKI